MTSHVASNVMVRIGAVDIVGGSVSREGLTRREAASGGHDRFYRDRVFTENLDPATKTVLLAGSTLHALDLEQWSLRDIDIAFTPCALLPGLLLQ